MNINQNQAFALASLVVVFFFLYIMVCTVMKLTLNEQIVSILAGAFMLVLGYYFGSSKGSAKKDETIAAMSAKPDGPTP